MTLLESGFGHAEIDHQPQFSAPGESPPDQWAERSRYWKEDAAERSLPRRKRERNPNPLILCGHGVSLRIENGALAVRDGFTHYPQERERFRFFPRDLELPTRILLLDGSGTLSFDVLNWLAAQGVALARVTWTGDVVTVASGAGYAADPARLQWQKDTRADNERRLSFAANLIATKIEASLATLDRQISPSPARDVAAHKAEAGIARLRGERFRNMNEVFAVEGECASSYFAAWYGLAMNWKGLPRRPVPEGWHFFSGRSSIATGVKAENRNASHPINAMLNYAYAVKLARVQIQAIADGYDPTLGIMHNGKRGNPAYALDMIEPERPKVDSAVLELISTRKFAAADFVIRPNGSCRLSPQLARVVATLVG